MARRRVLPLRPLEEPAGDRRGTRLRRTPFERQAFPSPSASRLGRSRPPTARAMLPSVLEPTSPYSSASGNSPAPTASSTITHARGTRAILGRLWIRLSDCSSLPPTSSAIVGLAAGITYAVIRIFPTERNPKKATSRTSRRDTAGTGPGAPLPQGEARNHLASGAPVRRRRRARARPRQRRRSPPDERTSTRLSFRSKNVRVSAGGSKSSFARSAPSVPSRARSNPVAAAGACEVVRRGGKRRGAVQQAGTEARSRLPGAGARPALLG